jgi:hypothetical protein
VLNLLVLSCVSQVFGSECIPCITGGGLFCLTSEEDWICFEDYHPDMAIHCALLVEEIEDCLGTE